MSTDVQSTDQVLFISGRSVRVRRQGTGRPVLLINGLGANLTMWNPLVSELAGFEVISFDAPGTGHSQAPLLPYSLSLIADVAVHVLDELGLGEVDVLGYSLGGGVAQTLAHRHPDRVRRLVLVSTSCGAGSVPGSLRSLMAVMTPARHYTKSGYRTSMKMISLAPAERQSSQISAEADNWHHEQPPSVRGYALQMTAFATFNSLPWLRTIGHPTLVMSGSDDRVVPMANAAILAAHLPHARMAVVNRWGHYLLHDPGSGASAQIRDFLGAEDVETSDAWQSAQTVSRKEMAEFIKSAPFSAYPTKFANEMVRRCYPLRPEAR